MSATGGRRYILNPEPRTLNPQILRDLSAVRGALPRLPVPNSRFPVARQLAILNSEFAIRRQPPANPHQLKTDH